MRAATATLVQKLRGPEEGGGHFIKINTLVPGTSWRGAESLPARLCLQPKHCGAGDIYSQHPGPSGLPPATLGGRRLQVLTLSSATPLHR